MAFPDSGGYSPPASLAHTPMCTCKVDVCSMCMILQGGGHGHSHGSSPRRTSPHHRHVEDVSFHMTDNSDDMVPATTFVTSTDESSNINVKAAFIHVIGDLLQSFGVLIAAYIIFYKVLLLLLLLLNESKKHMCELVYIDYLPLTRVA